VILTLALSLIWGLSSGCSLLLDADRKQCSEDSDCLALGFAGSACSAGICQAATSTNVGTIAAADASLAPVGEAGMSDTDASRPDASLHSAPDASVSATSDASQPERSANDAAADACVGASCPECALNADCDRRGIPGGICADGKCWAQAPQCQADGDCMSRGPEYVGGRCLSTQCRPNPRWRCEAPPPAPTSGTKQLSALVRDSLSLNPLPNVRAVICPKLDLQCTAPIGEATTQADGILMLTVPANFAGYLKVEETDYQPAMYFLPAVFPADGVLQPFPLLSSGLIIDALALALGTGIDRSRGHMMLIAEDCLGAALAGVTFSSPQRDKSTVQFYVRDLLPSTSATETAEVGNGGFLNFPPGTAVLSLKKVDSGLNLTTVSVFVRAGFISVAYIRPDRR
jgi:hypothetical protein